MSINTKKKLMAAFAGAWWYMFVELLWYLPDLRRYEGLDWRIELVLYILTLLPAIFYTWLASD